MPKARKSEKAALQRDYILLDRSGSMATKWSDALGGINAYVRGLAEATATKGVLVNLALFDQGAGDHCSFDVIRRDVSASEWKDVTSSEAKPRGGTPLFDAIGKLVSMAQAAAPVRCAILVMTDGEENASREHSKASAKALLDACRARGWQVIFLGADFDNAAQAASVGNDMAATMSYGAGQAVNSMRMTAAKRGLYGSGAAATVSFSDDEKKSVSGA